MSDKPESKSVMPVGNCTVWNMESRQTVKCPLTKLLEVVMIHSTPSSAKLVQATCYNSKRIRSEESIENLNCENKIRLIDISQSNNINSSSRNEGHVKKRLFTGSQSDLMLPQPSTKAAVKQPMTTDIKRVCPGSICYISYMMSTS